LRIVDGPHRTSPESSLEPTGAPPSRYSSMTLRSTSSCRSLSTRLILGSASSASGGGSAVHAVVELLGRRDHSGPVGPRAGLLADQVVVVAVGEGDIDAAVRARAAETGGMRDSGHR